MFEEENNVINPTKHKEILSHKLLKSYIIENLISYPLHDFFKPLSVKKTW